MSTMTATTDRLSSLITAANGRRRERTLSSTEVASLVADVAEGREFASMHGGTVAAAYRYRAITTVAVAARVDGEVYLGVRIGAAHAASAGRAWGELQPCGADGPRGDRAAKLRAWAASEGVIRLTKAEVKNFRNGY